MQDFIYFTGSHLSMTSLICNTHVDKATPAIFLWRLPHIGYLVRRPIEWEYIWSSGWIWDRGCVGVTQYISLMLASSVDSLVFLNPFCIQYVSVIKSPPVSAWDIDIYIYIWYVPKCLVSWPHLKRATVVFFVFHVACWRWSLLRVAVCSTAPERNWDYIYFFPAWLPLWNKVYLMPYSESVLCVYLWFLTCVCGGERADAAGLNNPV